MVENLQLCALETPKTKHKTNVSVRMQGTVLALSHTGTNLILIPPLWGAGTLFQFTQKPGKVKKPVQTILMACSSRVV